MYSTIIFKWSSDSYWRLEISRYFERTGWENIAKARIWRKQGQRKKSREKGKKRLGANANAAA